MIYPLLFELDSDNAEYEAELKIKYNIFHDGIGKFEHFGFVGYDKGQPQIEIEDYKILSICLDGGKLPPEKITKQMLDEIERKFHTDKVQESIKNEIWDNQD